MKDNLKKLTEETKIALIKSITSDSCTDLIAKTKSSNDGDSGSFRVIISTADVDRQGESVDQTGWDLSFYKSNPIVLWAHDYGSLPIGMCTKIEVDAGKLIAEGKFAPEEANPFAQKVRKLYDLGMINTTSVGFIPKEFNMEKDGVISKSELLEFSFVPVPANPFALRLDQIKELGLDLEMLKTKGMEFKINEPESIKFSVEEEIKSLHNKIDSIIIALRDSKELSDGKKSEEPDPNKRSASSNEIKEINLFTETRQLLKVIDNAVEKALYNFNTKIGQDRK